MESSPTIDWVVLTTGNRPVELGSAVRSLLDRKDENDQVIVVSNGAGRLDLGSDVCLVVSDHNLGVPGGRDLGVRSGCSEIIAFLDDDAVLLGGVDQIRDVFEHDDQLAAVALRLIDEQGQSMPRHIPRFRGARPSETGAVAYFLGGASALRRTAYDEVGGYFRDLHYGHEEIELSWRLIDAGWSIRYLADVTVFHPRAEISRHRDGWFLTGRNRVWIARRTLPWPIAIFHTVAWLLLGIARAGPTGRGGYVDGWWTGWRTLWPSAVVRQPIGWAAVWRLTRLGRPPII